MHLQYRACSARLHRRIVRGCAIVAPVVLSLAGFALTPHFARAESPPEAQPAYELQELRPGIYRTRNDRHYGVVLEGTENLLVFDPLGLEYAHWLNGELRRRFNKPVRYVVYSHNHADHVSGGQAFTQHRPLYIAHELAAESIRRMQVDTQPPELTFETALALDLDGKRVELRYWGPNDGRGSIILFVPEDRFLAVIDWALADRVGYRALARYDADGMIRSLEAIDKLDWDLISPGHAGTGAKADVRRYRRYLETIRAGVLAGLRSGRSEDQVVETVHAELAAEPEFRALKMFDAWARDNIRGVYRQLAAQEGAGDN